MAYMAKDVYQVGEINSESIKNLPLELPRSQHFLFNRELILNEFFRRISESGRKKIRSAIGFFLKKKNVVDLQLEN